MFQENAQLHCPRCKSSNDPHAVFCGNCGYRLESSRLTLPTAIGTPAPLGREATTQVKAAREVRTPVFSPGPTIPPWRKSGIILAFAALLIVATVGAFLLGGLFPRGGPGALITVGTPSPAGTLSPSRTASQESTSTPTEAPVTYPKLAPQYTGSAHNITCMDHSVCFCFHANGQADPPCDYTLILSSLAQHHNEVSGVLTLDALFGSGTFSGNVSSDGTINFTVSAGEVFTGTVHSDGSMNGTWKASAGLNSRNGTWQVSPS